MFSIQFFLLKLAKKLKDSFNLRCLSKRGDTWLTLSQHGVRLKLLYILKQRRLRPHAYSETTRSEKESL